MAAEYGFQIEQSLDNQNNYYLSTSWKNILLPIEIQYDLHSVVLADLLHWMWMKLLQILLSAENCCLY